MNKLLVINASQPDLRFSLFVGETLQEIAAGSVNNIGQARSAFNAQDFSKKTISAKTFPGGLRDYQDALDLLLNFLKSYWPEITDISHRILEGGEDNQQPTLINKINFESLLSWQRYAPLANQAGLQCLQQCLERFPQARNFAIFESACFGTMAPPAYLLPLPLAWQREYKIRKSGWHGIAHQQAARLAAKELKQSFKRLKILSCCLTEKPSLVAFKNGQIMDFVGDQSLTAEIFGGHSIGSFNWSSLDNFAEVLQASPEKVFQVLTNQAGSRGLCGCDSLAEMLRLAENSKVIGEKEKEQTPVLLGREVLAYNLAKAAASLLGLLGKVDAVVFWGELAQYSWLSKKICALNHLPPETERLTVKVNLELALALQVKQLLADR